jgi:hypothetical protein
MEIDTCFFSTLVSLLSRQINLPVAAFISIFFTLPSADSYQHFCAPICFECVSKAKGMGQKSTIYLITVDNLMRCICYQL